MKIDPKNIVKRHDSHPEATEALIESYAFNEYKKCVQDLLNVAEVVNIDDTEVSMIVLSKNNFKLWQSLQLSHWHLNKHEFMK